MEKTVADVAVVVVVEKTGVAVVVAVVVAGVVAGVVVEALVLHFSVVERTAFERGAVSTEVVEPMLAAAAAAVDGGAKEHLDCTLASHFYTLNQNLLFD